MIEKLQELIPRVLEATKRPEGWDSLIINRRKPFTYRVFQNFDGLRVCLHKFDPCEPDDEFPHPHPWPGAFLLLKGEYVHHVGGSPDLTTPPEFYFREITRPYSMYEIINPHTWHRVQPLKETWTVMVNGEPWEAQHKETRTTKGKDLQKMTPEDLKAHLDKFTGLLTDYLAYEAIRTS